MILHHVRSLLLVLLLGAPAVARAYCHETTVKPKAGQLCATTGIPLFWERQCITYSVMEPDAEIASLEDAQAVADRSFGAWLDVRCGDAPLALDVEPTAEPAACLMPQYNRHSANANSVLFLQDWKKYEAMPGDAFGLTLVYFNPDTGSIYDADIMLNASLAPLTICGDACPSGAVDIQNVLTHEVGHFFGLGHSDQTDATMAPNAGIGQLSKRSLTSDDRAGLCEIYGDYAKPNCGDDDFTPNHGFSTQCGAPEIDSGTASPSSSSSSSSSGCSVQSIRPARRTIASAVFFAALALFCARRARRASHNSAHPRLFAKRFRFRHRRAN